MTPYNFTDGARTVLSLAGDEAAAFGHEYIGTEHILLALLRDRDDVAVVALNRVGADLDEIRGTINATVKRGTSTIPAETPRPFTSRVKQVLELARLAARDDNQSPVGTQHLVLALLREKMGIAAQALQHAGVTVAALELAIGGAAGDA